MKNLVAIAAASALLLGGGTTALAQSPEFEVKGLPITLVQAQVVGFPDIQEQSSPRAVTLCGMPASPSQVAVLTPRVEVSQLQKIVEGLKAQGYSDVRLDLPPEYHGTAMRNGVLVNFIVDSRTGLAR